MGMDDINSCGQVKIVHPNYETYYFKNQYVLQHKNLISEIKSSELQACFPHPSWNKL